MFTQTLTFCECAENHVGMEKIGEKADTGYSINDLRLFESRFKALSGSSSGNTKLIDISNYGQEAGILVIRNGVNLVLESKEESLDSSSDSSKDLANAILKEHLKIQDLWDKKALMGRGDAATVKNKNARHNLCFADRDQEPDYINGKGRIIDFKDPRISYTNILREFLNNILREDHLKNPLNDPLVCEANYYYDLRKTYIGFHGDTERSKVIGVRFGASMPLYFQWFYQNSKAGSMYSLTLNHGDIYIMSSKAVGTDWKRSSIYTLRHAAGLEATLRKTVGPNRFFEDLRFEESSEGSDKIKHLD